MKSKPLLSSLLIVLPMSSFAQTQCFAPASAIELPQFENPDDIIVEANQTLLTQGNVGSFFGNVDITSQNARISAQQARIDRLARSLRAQGNVSYQDDAIRVESEDVNLDMSSGSLQLNTNEYSMITFNGRGEAELILLNQNEGVLLQDVSFTTCAPSRESWKIQAQEIEIEKGDNWGKIRNAKLYVADIPILYLPYFQFPLTDERETGLLFPTDISTASQTGISYEQPIYLNLAPNYDATIAPRILTNRGLQLNTEFRYLFENHAGQLNFEYLDSDQDLSNNDSRYFFRYVQNSQLSENWTLKADINDISDDNYIVDLGSRYYNRADTHLFQTISVSYLSENLDFSGTFRDFEVIGTSAPGYRALPNLSLDYRLPFTSALKFDVHSEFAYFDSSDSQLPTATRLHIEPTLSLPYQNQYFEFLAEGKLFQTYYDQEQVEGFDLDESASRTIGQGLVSASLNFERPAKWKKKAATQTLEPQIQYLITSFENQDRIGLFDTTRLLNDYVGLFRGQSFTGLDRISDNNQLTVGLSSRILDENNQEQIRVSVGQIFFFGDNRVLGDETEAQRLAFAGQLDWRISSKWAVQSEFQLSDNRSRVERTNISIDYQFANNKLVQLNHRFVRDISGEEVEQIGLTTTWPIAENWQFVGRWYRDLELSRTIEFYAGVQYESCCWSISLVTQRSLTNRFDPNGVQNTEEFDSGVALQFSFKGLGSPRTSRDLLDEGLFGYRQPYLLNN